MDPITANVTTVLILLLAVAIFALMASKLGVPYPTMMVLGGLAIASILVLSSSSSMQKIKVEPNLIFILFLPPLLYGSAWQISWKEFQANWRTIALMAVGLVLFTTAGVAILAMLFFPAFTWASAFALGAIVSPPDAIAVTALTQKIRLPRKLVMLLEGESLVNDASALVALRFAMDAGTPLIAAAAATAATTVATQSAPHSFSLLDAAFRFVLVSAGGVALGLALGWLVTQIHRRIQDPLIETTLTFLTPYAVFLLGDRIGVSGVLAVVTTGLYVSWRSHLIFSPHERILATTVWEFVLFVLNGFVFVLVGLALPEVWDSIRPFFSLFQLFLYGSVLILGMIALRMAWVIPSTFLPYLLSPKVRKNSPRPSMRQALLIGWTGMRGVVSLAAALALAPGFGLTDTQYVNAMTASAANPHHMVLNPVRGLIIFLTFFIILITLVAQSITLPWVVRFLKIHSDIDEVAEERDARLYAAKAALTFLKDLTESTDAFGESGKDLRKDYEHRIWHLESGPAALPLAQVGIDTSAIDLQREALAVERQAIVEMRANQKISNELYQRMMADVDAAELHPLMPR